MEWHEILAWAILTVVAIMVIVWLVKAIVCPSSRCEGCDKDCKFRETKQH